VPQKPTRATPPEYPDRFEVLHLSANGNIQLNCHLMNFSSTCIDKYVGVGEIDAGSWNVYFEPLKLFFRTF
jgi:hypothetical protein